MRSSTRATSVGSVRAWKELGLMLGFSRVNVPVATRASVSCGPLLVGSGAPVDAVRAWSARRLRRRSRGCPGGSWAPVSGRSCVGGSLSRIRGFRLAVRRWTSRPSSGSTEVSWSCMRFARLRCRRLICSPGRPISCSSRTRDGARVTPVSRRHLLDRSRVVCRPERAQQSRIRGLWSVPGDPNRGPTDRLGAVRVTPVTHRRPPDSLISGTPRGSAILVQSFAR